jgi:hypothetical protein
VYLNCCDGYRPRELKIKFAVRYHLPRSSFSDELISLQSKSEILFDNGKTSSKVNFSKLQCQWFPRTISEHASANSFQTFHIGDGASNTWNPQLKRFALQDSARSDCLKCKKYKKEGNNGKPSSPHSLCSVLQLLSETLLLYCVHFTHSFVLLIYSYTPLETAGPINRSSGP